MAENTNHLIPVTGSVAWKFAGHRREVCRRLFSAPWGLRLSRETRKPGGDPSGWHHPGASPLTFLAPGWRRFKPLALCGPSVDIPEGARGGVQRVSISGDSQKSPPTLPAQRESDQTAPLRHEAARSHCTWLPTLESTVPRHRLGEALWGAEGEAARSPLPLQGALTGSFRAVLTQLFPIAGLCPSTFRLCLVSGRGQRWSHRNKNTPQSGFLAAALRFLFFFLSSFIYIHSRKCIWTDSFTTDGIFFSLRNKFKCHKVCPLKGYDRVGFSLFRGYTTITTNSRPFSSHPKGIPYPPEGALVAPSHSA